MNLSQALDRLIAAAAASNFEATNARWEDARAIIENDSPDFAAVADRFQAAMDAVESFSARCFGENDDQAEELTMLWDGDMPDAVADAGFSL